MENHWRKGGNNLILSMPSFCCNYLFLQFCKMLKKLKTVFLKYLTDQSYQDIFIFRLTHFNRMWHKKKPMQTYKNIKYSICFLSYFALSVETAVFRSVTMYRLRFYEVTLLCNIATCWLKRATAPHLFLHLLFVVSLFKEIAKMMWKNNEKF